MRPVPLKQRKEMEQVPFFQVCAKAGLPGHVCQGRVTWDHPLTFAGKQIIEAWATVPLCEYGHSVNKFQDGGDYNKTMSIWIALNRVTDEELRKVSKCVNYQREKERLNDIYGPYDEEKAISAYTAKAKPVETRNINKPFWYPMAEERKKKLQTVIDHYAEIDEVYFTPFKMIDHTIDSYCDEVIASIEANN